MEKEIESKINSLDDSSLIEASGFFLIENLKLQDLLADINQIIKRAGINRGDFTLILKQLSNDRKEYNKLLKFILSSSLEKNEPNVELAIEGVGQKQGITEIAIILSLAMAFIIKLYQMKQTASKESEEEQIDVEKTSDGYKVNYIKKTLYVNSESGLGKFLEVILKNPPNRGK